MSARPLFKIPLRQFCRQSSTQSRYVHNVPKRPLLLRPQLRQYRHAGSVAANARTLFRNHPFSVTLAVIIILGGTATLGYANYFYQTYIIGAFHKYPEPVAQKLRRALYFTNTDLQPQEALKYYKQALQVAEEMEMDPFSDEIIGVKIQVAFLMEKVSQWHKAIEVLERVRNDNLKWIELFGNLEHNKVRRTNILAKTIAISVKLGELYGHPTIYDRDMAEERLVWAVEASLKEQQRRQSNQVSEEDEGKWLTNEEIGASLESLAHSYEAKDLHYLATPLFLQALSLYPAQDCHSVVLMNNLASSLAQQSPRAARAAQTYATSRDITEKPAGPVATKEMMLQNAKTWAHKALEVAAHIRPPLRTEECDIGCAVATHNLGEFAEMSQDVAEATRRYKEAISLSRAVGFHEGVENGSARLRELGNAG